MSKGVFSVYPVGKSADESKRGKRMYTFLEGMQVKENGNLFDNCNVIEFWSDENLKLEFMKPINAVLDRSTMVTKDGNTREFTKLLEILPDTTTLAELQGIIKRLTEEDRVEKLRKRKEDEERARDGLPI